MPLAVLTPPLMVSLPGLLWMVSSPALPWIVLLSVEPDSSSLKGDPVTDSIESKPSVPIVAPTAVRAATPLTLDDDRFT